MGQTLGMDSRLRSFNIPVSFRYRWDYRGRNADAVVEVLPRLLGGEDNIIYNGGLSRSLWFPGVTLDELNTPLDAGYQRRASDKVRDAH